MSLANRLNKLIEGQSSTEKGMAVLNSYKNNNLSKPLPESKPKTILIEGRKKLIPKVAPAIKQYGDKGYKPSNGMGVGM